MTENKQPTKSEIKKTQTTLNFFKLFIEENFGAIMPPYLIVDGFKGLKTEWMATLMHSFYSGGQGSWKDGKFTIPYIQSGLQRYASTGCLILKKGCKPLVLPSKTSVYKGESHFGGDVDPYDRMYGQRNLTRKVERPCDIPKIYKDCWELFDNNCLQHKEFPMTTNDKGQPRRAGLSYFLDEETAWYGAVLKNLREMGYVNNNCLRLLITNPENGIQVVLAITDKGPHPDTKCQLDMSNNAYSHLKFKKNSDYLLIQVIHNSAPLGPFKQDNLTPLNSN